MENRKHGFGVKKFPLESQRRELPIKTNRQSLSPRRIKCDFCRGRFKNHAEMKSHVRKVHGYACFTCLKVFKTSEEAYIHWKTGHVPEMQISEAVIRGESARYLTAQDASDDYRALGLEKGDSSTVLWDEKSSRGRKRKRRSSENISSVGNSPRKSKRHGKQFDKPGKMDGAEPCSVQVVKDCVSVDCSQLPEDLSLCNPAKFLDSGTSLAPYLEGIGQKCINDFWKSVR